MHPAQDTLRFAAPAVTHRCQDGRSLLLEGAGERGNGVLVLLRYGDSVASGSFPVLAPGDSLTPRGAAVAVRYMKGDVAFGFALDSGAVELTAASDPLDARVRGSGFESAVRIALNAEFTGLAPAIDTVPCRVQR